MRFFCAHGLSEQGPVRTSNQDCFALDDEHGLCVVADGMGGHNGGDVASQIAVAGVTNYIRATNGDRFWPFGFDPALSRPGNLLRTAVCVANEQILAAASGRPELQGMGTTIVAGLVQDGMLSVAHVGDSRLYIFSAGQLRRLTTDDSWAHNPNVLTNVLGARPRVEVHVAEEALRSGDLLLLLTDGVHGSVDDDTIGQAVRSMANPAELVNTLVQIAIARGSRDNCTVVAATYGPR